MRTTRRKLTREKNDAAIEAATGRAGRSVVFSGLTVAVGLLALVTLPVSCLRSTGFAGMFVPLTSVAVAITLLPVILATAGARLDWPRLRKEGSASRPWTAWARLVCHRKWAALAGGAALALPIVPALSMHIRVADSVATAAPGPARTAMTTLTAGGVPAGILTPMEMVVRGAANAAAAVATAVRRVPGIAAAKVPGYTRARNVAGHRDPGRRDGSPAGLGTAAAVRNALDAAPHVIGVGGDGPALADFNHAVYGNFPLMLALIGIATLTTPRDTPRSAASRRDAGNTVPAGSRPCWIADRSASRSRPRRAWKSSSSSGGLAPSKYPLRPCP